MLIFVGYKVDGTSGELRIFNSKTATDIIVYGIGSVICAGYFYVILIRIIIIIGVTKSKYALQDSDQKTIKSEQRNLWKKLLNLFKVLMANIHNYDLWCLIPCLIFALTAISYRPYFFVFCIIAFLIYSNSLMEVVLALWIPKHRILWTLFLTMCVIYIYSVLSLALFRNDYSQNISNSWDTVFNCYVTIADQWYKNNGLGGFLSINAPAISLNNSFSVNWGRFSFDLIFFIVVPTLLINIIFSIIVDNFAERRAKRDQLRENQLSQCFVCGKLDNDIEDFIQHTKYMHNCWDYVYYIGYLNSTAYEDLVDYADVCVKKMIESNKFEWFPCYFRENNKDFSITSPIQKMSSRLETLEKNIIEVKNINKEMEKNITEMKESIIEMKDNNKEMKESNKEMEKRNIEMKESITGIEKSIKETKECNKEIKKSITEIENGNKETKESNKEMEKRNIETKESITEIEKSIKETKECKEEVKESITQMKKSNKKTKKCKEEVKESITQMKKSNKKTKKCNKEVKKSIKEMKKSNKETKKCNKEIKESIIEMENKIENRFGKIEEMFSQLLSSQNR